MRRKLVVIVVTAVVTAVSIVTYEHFRSSPGVEGFTGVCISAVGPVTQNAHGKLVGATTAIPECAMLAGSPPSPPAFISQTP